MKRSIASVAAALALSLGLLASLPAEAGNKNGHKHGHGYKHGQQHGYKHGYKHGHGKHVRQSGYRHGSHYGRHHGHRHDHRGFADSTLLAAVGIAAGAEVVSAYLQGPPPPQPATVYAAPTYVVRQPICQQVLVPYQHPYGGYYYAPQVQCY